jgi:UDP-2-acetamido-3-amino-2,3-dideoxy-glucuronate N-acetyltransferase
MKVAVVGLGPWGQNLARNFDQLGALGALYDSHPARLGEVAARYPRARALYSWQEALSAPQIDALVLATPAATHAALGREALLAGRDVWIEKPLALSSSEGEALVQLAATQKRLLMCGLLLAYHPALVALCEAVSRGDLGRVLHITSRRANLGRARFPEGALHSLAPHDVDLLLQLAGAPLAETWARGAAHWRAGVEDWCSAGLSFENGVKAELYVSWVNPVKEQQLVVVGESGALVFDDLSPGHKLHFHARRHTGEGESLSFLGERPAPVPYASGEPLRAACAHFLECLQTRQSPRTDGARALRGLRVLDSLRAQLQSA